MSTNDLLIDVLRDGLGMLKMTVGDLTDAELIQRPVPNANNGLWQLGHLIGAEAWMINGAAGKTVIELPAGFTDRYSKQTASSDDPATLGNKADLLALFEKVRAQTVKWAQTLNAADLAKPGPEKMRQITPTVGHVLALLPAHVGMHAGQLQVLRRKLGKPVMF